MFLLTPESVHVKSRSVSIGFEQVTSFRARDRRHPANPEPRPIFGPKEKFLFGNLIIHVLVRLVQSFIPNRHDSGMFS